jgi:hypothetical protein
MGFSSRYTYFWSFPDQQVHVFDGEKYLGVYNQKTNKITLPISEAETNRMLSEALARKPRKDPT